MPMLAKLSVASGFWIVMAAASLKMQVSKSLQTNLPEKQTVRPINGAE